MGKRKTHEQFVEELSLINNDIEVIGEYTGALEHIQCKCRICGNIWNPPADKILRGTCCPVCSLKRSKNKKTRSHEEFVRLAFISNPKVTIVGKYKNKRNKIECSCNICGYKWNTFPDNILQGSGCPKCAIEYRKSLISLSHEEFLERLYKVNNNIELISNYTKFKDKILCKCKTCGCEWEVIAGNSLKGIGCPNCNISKGEFKISNFLKDNNIEYILHYKYNDLRGVNNGMLSYDFYLPYYNILIEYNGAQHFKPIERFGGEEKFIVQQEHDKRKREYANSHNIKLIEIPYWDFDNIEDILKSHLFNNQVA